MGWQLGDIKKQMELPLPSQEKKKGGEDKKTKLLEESYSKI